MQFQPGEFGERPKRPRHCERFARESGYRPETGEQRANLARAGFRRASAFSSLIFFRRRGNGQIFSVREDLIHHGKRPAEVCADHSCHL